VRFSGSVDSQILVFSTKAGCAVQVQVLGPSSHLRQLCLSEPGTLRVFQLAQALL
jgi:hypothetical protein